MNDLPQKPSKDVLGAINNSFISHFISEIWGSEILIMEKAGKAFARVYWYKDDATSIYLDWLHVSYEIRNKGIGTELQNMREQIGRNLGASTSCLWVKKDSWMHNWYKRRGYSDLEDYEQEENVVWMMKSL